MHQLRKEPSLSFRDPGLLLTLAREREADAKQNKKPDIRSN